MVSLNMEDDALAGTAVAVAVERARESARPDALFHDPLGAAILERFGATTPSLGDLAPIMRDYVAFRTVALDAALLAATAASEGVRQVVLLGAGLDARAFRLPWPGDTTIYELDRATTLAAKDDLVAAAGLTAPAARRRMALAADLRDTAWAAALAAAGHDAARPTAWLAEGLLMYLTTGENDALLDRVTALSAPGSHLLAEHVPRAGAARDDRDRDPGHALGTTGADWRSTSDTPLAWLNAHGWRAAEIDTATWATASGRPLPPVLKGDGRAHLLAAALTPAA